MLVRTDIVLPELARRSAHSSSARAWLISSSSHWSSTALAYTSAADSIGSYAERLTAPFFARHPRTAPSVRRQSQVNNRFKLPYVVCGTG